MSLFNRVSNLFSRSKVNREIDAELNSHIEMREEDNLAAGMSPKEARRDAMLRFGNATVTQERIAAIDIALVPGRVWADAKFALRQLARNPGFAFATILMLVLGISANVAIFAFVDAAMIKPLPYQQPKHLVALFASTALGPRFHLSAPDYLDWKRFNKVFSSLEAYDTSNFQLSSATGAEQTEGAVISDGFFRTLGITPVLGRDFQPNQDVANAPPTVLLSYAAWQKRYGGSPEVLGKSVNLDGIPNTIIGVLPQTFHFAPTEPAEFWTLMHPTGSEERGSHSLSAIARLKDGVSLQTASIDMSSIAAQLARQYPDADEGRGATVLPLSDVIIGNLGALLLLLLSGAGLLLLIACVNVASLLLVRSESRRREFALRGALGASSKRLIGQLVTEGMILAGIGTALGIASSLVAMRLLVLLIPKSMMISMPYLQNIRLDGHVLLFATGDSLLAVLLFAIVPMIRLPSSDIRSELAEGGRSAAGTTWRRLGSKLVVVELATAMVLLAGAGLLGKSFYRLLHTDLGMLPDHVVTLHVSMSRSGKIKDNECVALAKRVASRVAALPGIHSVGIGHSLPVGGAGGITTFHIAGRPVAGRPADVAGLREMDGSYFATLQTRLLRGRYFTANEDASRPHVMIINKTMVTQYFAHEDPLGKHIIYDDSKPPIEIVGVVDDIKEGPLDQATSALMYVPFDQDPDPNFFVLARTSLPEESLLPTMEVLIHAIDSGIVISRGETMSHRINNSYAAYLHRASAWLVGGFAAVALVLSVVGLYGVIAYSVSQRTREIGVRIALGAQRSSVYQMILGEAGGLAVTGIAIGLLLSIGTATLMQKLLFGTAAWDVPTLAGVAALLGVSCLLASYLPARRAALVNPVEALRAE
jgi:macrolide transport system ATP-binding/permease protein